MPSILLADFFFVSRRLPVWSCSTIAELAPRLRTGWRWKLPGEKDRFGMVQDLPHCHEALAAWYEFAIGEEALALGCSLEHIHPVTIEHYSMDLDAELLELVPQIGGDHVIILMSPLGPHKSTRLWPSRNRAPDRAWIVHRFPPGE